MDHPKKGLPVKIVNGPLKGRFFYVTNYVTTQFQGKDIQKIRKVHPELGLEQMEGRGFPVDSKAVFGRLYPSMAPMCVHDDELRVDMKLVETETGESVEVPANVSLFPPPKTDAVAKAGALTDLVEKRKSKTKPKKKEK